MDEAEKEGMLALLGGFTPGEDYQPETYPEILGYVGFYSFKLVNPRVIYLEKDKPTTIHDKVTYLWGTIHDMSKAEALELAAEAKRRLAAKKKKKYP